MSIPIKQILSSEMLEIETAITGEQAEAEQPHYGLLALLAITLFAITVSQLDRMVTAPPSAPAALVLSAR